MNKIIFSLICVSLLTVPIFFLVKNEEIFEFNKMLLTYFFVSCILTFWGIKTILDKKFTFRTTPLDRWIVLFFLSQLISTALSMHPRTSLLGYYTRFHGGLLSTVAYIILFYATTTFVQKKQLKLILGSVLTGGLFAALYAFPEHFGHSPSCVILTNQFDASCWIQDVQSRVFGTFGQPNWLAAFLILILPLAYGLMLLPNKMYKAAGAFLTVLFVSTVLFTQSRSGFLGMVVGTVIFFGLTGIHFLRSGKATQKHPSQMFSAVALIVLILGVIGIFGSPFSPKISTLFAKKSVTIENPAPAAQNVDRLEAGGTDSGEIRQIVWQGAFDVWKRYPVFGSGVETFAYSYYKDRPMAHNNVSEWDFLYNKAHNELLNYLATTSAVGLTAYLLLHAITAWFLFKQALFSESHKEKLLSTAVLSGLIALHISNFFGFSTVAVTLFMYVLPALVIVKAGDGQHLIWQIFSLSPAKTSALEQKKTWLVQLLININPLKKFTTTNDTPSKSVSKWQWFCISLVTMVGLFLSIRVFTIWLADHNYADGKTAYKENDLNTALDKVKVAIELSPQEALYYDLYSKIAAQYALNALAQQDEVLGNQLAESAIQASNTALILNPVHLNFYKSRNQLLVTLAQVQPEFYDSSIQTLKAAQELSPTDPKLVYFEGVILNAQDKNDEALERLKKSVEMKPNYDSARFLLGQILEEKKDFSGAKEQYSYILENINPDNEQVKARFEAIATLEAKPKK